MTNLKPKMEDDMLVEIHNYLISQDIPYPIHATIRDLLSLMRLSSTSVVGYWVEKLRDAGYLLTAGEIGDITAKDNSRRGIVISKEGVEKAEQIKIERKIKRHVERANLIKSQNETRKQNV